MPRYRGTRYALAAPDPVRRFTDTFADTNGVLLSAHAMDRGGGWTVHTGGFDIQSGRANHTANGGDGLALASVDVGRSDARPSCTLVAEAETAAPGLAFRVVDGQNFWYATVSSALDLFRLIEATANTYTIRASASAAIGFTDHVVSATMVGESIAVLLDGGNELTYSSASHLAATRHGIYAEGSTLNDAQHDDFEVVA